MSTVQYVSYLDIQNQLNASSAGTSYTVFGLTVTQAAFQAHVDFANLYANSIAGQALLTTDPRYSWARLLALNLACLRVLVAAGGGMLLGAFDYRLSDLFITRANVTKVAFQAAVAGFKDDLVQMLMNFATPIATADAQAAEDVPTYKGGLISP